MLNFFHGWKLYIITITVYTVVFGANTIGKKQMIKKYSVIQ